jgi:hypothetical protein
MRLTTIIEGFNSANDEQLSRPLLESVIVPEITSAIKDWIGADVPGILIGGLALSFYGKPRYTSDIDVLFISDNDVPDNIRGFKRIRSHAFQHNKTHVEVEVLSANFLGIPDGLVKQVANTAVESNGMKVASRSGLVALKLQRLELQDQADIDQLIKTGEVDLTPYAEWLTNDQMIAYNKIKG